MKEFDSQCSECGGTIKFEQRSHRYAECGISNLVLKRVLVAECPQCGNTEFILPGLGPLHRAIARALVTSPGLLTGEQLRFLRKHAGLNAADFSSYLHITPTILQKWESGEENMSVETDGLIRLLIAILDSDIEASAHDVVEHLPRVGLDAGADYEIQLDGETLIPTFCRVLRAA